MIGKILQQAKGRGCIVVVFIRAVQRFLINGALMSLYFVATLFATGNTAIIFPVERQKYELEVTVNRERSPTPVDSSAREES